MWNTNKVKMDDPIYGVEENETIGAFQTYKGNLTQAHF